MNIDKLKKSHTKENSYLDFDIYEISLSYYSLLKKSDNAIGLVCRFSKGEYGEKYLEVENEKVEKIHLNINLLEVSNKTKFVSNCAYMSNENLLYINIFAKKQIYNQIEENLIKKVFPKSIRIVVTGLEMSDLPDGGYIWNDYKNGKILPINDFSMHYDLLRENSPLEVRPEFTLIEKILLEMSKVKNVLIFTAGIILAILYAIGSR